MSKIVIFVVFWGTPPGPPKKGGVDVCSWVEKNDSGFKSLFGRFGGGQKRGSGGVILTQFTRET